MIILLYKKIINTFNKILYNKALYGGGGELFVFEHETVLIET